MDGKLVIRKSRREDIPEVEIRVEKLIERVIPMESQKAFAAMP